MGEMVFFIQKVLTFLKLRFQEGNRMAKFNFLPEVLRR
jgi:hypothetical protein